ncbi:MAG TPA: UDP-3-O-(3-hydroxymyristoyl)glucosamine N-acyltransferase [Burkholderiales bacterium]|nr:UDP-3-O-(3-hydroxymyristoyl)glucosamine N-acyltransferase [Burkholderiales bacterium]
MSVTLAELARLVKAELRGDADVRIESANSLKNAEPGQIAFVAHARHADDLRATRASAVVMAADIAPQYRGNALIVENPSLAFAQICALLHPSAKPPVGVHATATIHPSARIASTASVGAMSIVEEDAEIGDGAIVGPASFVGRGVRIGKGTRLYARVVIQERCRIGNDCLLQPGVVIGADGFGFARDGNRWVKQPQLGRVVIGDNVEIGANTTIDRGTLGDTEIGNGVKLDNLVHIAHNVRIGEDTAIAACVGVAGSTVIGKRCTVAGQAGIKDHVEIVDDVHITAASAVIDSITQPGVYSGTVRAQPAAQWRRNAVRLSQLDDLAQRVRRLEKQLQRFVKE